MMTLAALVAICQSVSQAATIVSFDVGASGEYALDAADEAGVISANNWNLLSGTGRNDSFFNAFDSNGGTTGIDLTITDADGVDWQGNTFHNLTGADANVARDIAYVNNDGGESFDTFNVTFDDIGFSSYDIYLYTGAGQSNWGGRITNTATNNSYFVRGLDSAATHTLAEETGTFRDAESGDYVLFAGLTGTTQSFDFTAFEQQIFFSGAQIVGADGGVGSSSSTTVSGVPEPSGALALAIAGGVGLMRRRRRKRA